MSQTQSLVERRAALIQKANEIDELALAASESFNTRRGFAQELQVAQAIVDLRRALTDDVMAPIMALMNTGLGFDTDRNPSKPGKGGQAPTPYSVDVVREVFIESKLRGFHTCGNEFNIISGKFYAARAGLERKCKEVCHDFVWAIGIPRRVGEGCIVPCSASWKTPEGVQRQFACEVPVKVNEYMGADAIVGKAERKLFKRVYALATGQSVPDGEAEDAPPQLGPATPAALPPTTFDAIKQRQKPTSEEAKTETPGSAPVPLTVLPSPEPVDGPGNDAGNDGDQGVTVQPPAGEPQASAQESSEPVTVPPAGPGAEAKPKPNLDQEWTDAHTYCEEALAQAFDQAPGAEFSDFRDWLAAQFTEIDFTDVQEVGHLSRYVCEQTTKRTGRLKAYLKKLVDARRAAESAKAKE